MREFQETWENLLPIGLREDGIVQLQARRHVPRLRAIQASKVGKPDVGLHQVALSKRATLVSHSRRERENCRAIPYVHEFKCQVLSHASHDKSGVHWRSNPFERNRGKAFGPSRSIAQLEAPDS